MDKKLLKILVALMVILFVFSAVSIIKQKNKALVTSYDQCVKAGYKVTLAYPAQCQTPQGQVFIQKVPSKNQLNVQDSSQITNFDQCAAAGNPILETYPEQCKTPDGRNFTKETATNNQPSDEKIEPTDHSVCKDTCGNGKCDEIVCMGSGCPCAETATSCPADCSHKPAQTDKACINMCGNGNCESYIRCIQAKDCPCEETPQSCPKDCNDNNFIQPY